MRVLYMTREYPPHVYGGAGVHLEHLAREVARHAEVEVRCFGEQHAPHERPAVVGHAAPAGPLDDNPRRAAAALRALQTSLRMCDRPVEADVVHTHTWYAALGGVVARLAYGASLVVTVHSLEPLRPWKREQLGRGHELSTWVERTALQHADAVIAVSSTSADDVAAHVPGVDPGRVHVIPNGVDADAFRPVASTAALRARGVDPDRPFVLFLGRASRQKGAGHFLRAMEHADPGLAAVLCAASPDTAAVADELARGVAALRRRGREVVWIREMLPREAAVELFSHAAVFCCPSVYEPFGIINLEAMACATPVVASAVGGIPDVVVPGETGLLVPLERAAADDPEPAQPGDFARALARAIDALAADPGRRARMGRRGRERVLQHFTWAAVARRTLDLYATVAAARRAPEGP